MADEPKPVKVVSKREHYLRLGLILAIVVAALFVAGQFFIVMPGPFIVLIFVSLISFGIILLFKDRKKRVDFATIGLSVAQRIYEESGQIIDTSPHNLEVGLMAEGIYYLHDKRNGLVYGYSHETGPFESNLSTLARTRRRLERSKIFEAFESELSARKELEAIKNKFGVKEVKGV